MKVLGIADVRDGLMFDTRSSLFHCFLSDLPGLYDVGKGPKINESICNRRYAP